MTEDQKGPTAVGTTVSNSGEGDGDLTVILQPSEEVLSFSGDIDETDDDASIATATAF